MKIIAIAPRIGAAVLSLVAFSVMASTGERRSGAGSTFKVKFSDFQAYNYLIALNVILFVYSTVQLVMLVNSNHNSSFSSPFKWVLGVYICDQLLAFLLFSASSSAATASELSRHGLHNIWPPACATWKLWTFCSKAEAAVAMSFLSSFFIITSSILSGYHLSKVPAV
uniref:CASP-like protein 3 n=1 Tax=Osmunda lancea TaxID=90694 RepID=CSPL3_OSMLA|nr:RecName: Full=CASP-like protein 3 [Osmunda lancea]